MKKLLLLFSVFCVTIVFAQEKEETEPEKITGHTDQSKFRQLKYELATPNDQHNAAGAPGHQYTQQKVDYIMDIRLDEEANTLYGNETITYHNNSKDNLEYLWVQLDQNMRADDSKTPLAKSTGASAFMTPENFKKEYLKNPTGYGFNIELVESNGKPLSYFINRTMMRINLSKPLASGETFEFRIKWNYIINNHVPNRDRSGYEPFPDGNNVYVIAQFFPRLAKYNNVEGWQNMQFWGRSEFALEFGDYEVNLTVPADHIVEATGSLQNEKDVLSKEQRNRYKKARNTFDNPVIIVSEEESIAASKQKSTKTKTWKFKANNVRDYAFATSRRFIWDAMAVKINGKTIMATSLYPKEGNPLWEKHSTRVVANTLEEYSKLTFDYPYPKAVSVHSKNQGMEYPMICWNYGRPKPDGTYSDRTRDAMIGVITHEVGHNFFPMIVNSDERQWTWMDEGLNSYMEMLAELAYDPNFPITRGYPKNIVRYMAGDQSRIAPIMTKGDNVYSFGYNAYGKPATGLWILRETIMGQELFDHAFKTYAKRWKFKHPTPADFFRTMEDASGVDLDWFWRGWFYTTDVTDIGIKNVKKFYTKKGEESSVKFTEDTLEGIAFSSEKPADSKYYYEITYEKPGGLVMPIIAEFTYTDGTKERKVYPAQIWRYNDKEVTKVFSSSKEVAKIVIDPDLETADVDTSNNSFPKQTENRFDKFKKQIKG